MVDGTVAAGLAIYANTKLGISTAGGALTAREKLLRLAYRAQQSNVLINPPWLVPPVWTTGEVIKSGQVRSNAGYWWVAENSATCGATPPTTPDTANVVSDGGVLWLYCGGPNIAANDPLPPTVTRSTSPPAGTYNCIWGPWSQAQPAAFKIFGGYQNPTQTTQLRLATFDQSASTTRVPGGGRFGFWCDAPTLYFLSGSNDPTMRIYVDNRVLDPGGYANGAANTYTGIDWSAVGGRRPRYYELESVSRNNNGFNAIGIYVTAKDTVWAPSSENNIRVVGIGDSFPAGSTFSSFRPGYGFFHQIAKRLGWNDPWNFSTGGTGYIATNGGTAYTYGQRIAEALTRTPDLWLFYGSTNDIGNSSAAITAAALACYQSIRTGGSTAPIIVLGVAPVGANATAINNAIAVETAIQSAVTAFNDSNCFMVPMANRTYPVTINSTNRPAALSANVNTFATQINNTDFIHPMEITFDTWSTMLTGDIRQNVLPNLLI